MIEDTIVDRLGIGIAAAGLSSLSIPMSAGVSGPVVVVIAGMSQVHWH